MSLLRRVLLPELGAMTVAGWAWRHRGTVLRTGDLARRSPSLLRDGRTSELVTEARAVLALDAHAPKATDLRISGIDAGTVSVLGSPGGRTVARAREALLDVAGVTDVRTDGSDLPTTESVLGAAARA